MFFMNQQRNSESSIWQKSFGFKDVKCLIVCRGPVRLETMQTFESMGASYGILLSEKDSIVYPQTLAPELRWIGKRNGKVHHVADYMGASREEKELRIEEILRICSRHSYTHLFAGYGFMAEDADFIQAVEDAGVVFVGPSARVIRKAGSKDEAKQLARKLGVSVTPASSTAWIKSASSAMKPYPAKRWVYECLEQIPSISSILSSFSSLVAPM